jgi:hypothetical protein
MIKTKECPNCHAEHRLHIKQCGCGYVWGASTEHKAQPVDLMHGCCEYTLDGKRCHYPGTLGSIGGGKVFCREHFGEIDPIKGARVLARSHEDVPSPDYSIEAIKRRSEEVFKRKLSAYMNKRAA